MFKRFEDFHEQCCWMENGVRCGQAPHAGSRHFSACEQHAVELRGKAQARTDDVSFDDTIITMLPVERRKLTEA